MISFSSYSGENLPDSSLSLVHFLNASPFIWPSSLTTSFGPHPPLCQTPSFNARSISSCVAGRQSSVSRDTIVTLFAPSLFAVTATSTATLPPPTTITSEPGLSFIQLFTSTRNSRPNLVRSSPSIPMIFLFHAPVSRNTLSYSFTIFSSCTSSPT